MKTLIIVSALVAIASAGVFKPHHDVDGSKQSSNINPDGSYSYQYETDTGISASESGVGGINAQGQFRYTAPDGTPVDLSYIADENGYQPSGSHLPVGPDVPSHIIRALEYIRQHPSEESGAGAGFSYRTGSGTHSAKPFKG